MYYKNRLKDVIKYINEKYSVCVTDAQFSKPKGIEAYRLYFKDKCYADKVACGFDGSVNRCDCLYYIDISYWVMDEAIASDDLNKRIAKAHCPKWRNPCSRYR